MGKPRAFTDEQEQQVIVPKYQAGASMGELALEFDVTPQTIRAVLNRCGVQARPAHVRPGKAKPRPRARLFSEAQAKELAERYEAGAWVSELAREFGVSRKAVNNALRRQGCVLRDKREAQVHLLRRRQASGEPPPNWKGGRTVNADGYVLVAIAPADPMWQMAKQRRRRTSFGHGYVFEHRLVMARHLGRPLTSSETVHHKNGKRDDNRVENLQLRNGKHGKGRALCCGDCGSLNIVSTPI